MRRMMVVGLLLSAACESDGNMTTSPKLDWRSSSALVTNIDMKLDITGTFWNDCVPGGEYVDVAGALHSRVQFRYDPAKSVYRVTIHENQQGVSGIGQTSGTKYQMMQTHNSIEIFSPGTEIDVTRHLIARMTSQGSAGNSEFHSIYDIHYDPTNGQVLTWRKLSIECRG